MKKQETFEEGYICPHTKKQCDDECCVSAQNCHIKTSIGVLEEPKQDLEKAIFNLEEELDIPSHLRLHNSKTEQDKNKYSEEEVRKIAEEVRWQAIGNPLEFTKNFEKWFEQFKKK
jgi:hypothetical protein